MLIYNYDSTTKEYTGSCGASLDPQETKAQGKDIYLIPAYATTVKPPKAKTNEVIIYDNGWQIKADYRGKYIVNEDMEPQQVEEIGDLPDGFIVITEAQAAKIIEDDLYYVISGGKLIKNPDYTQQKKARENAQKIAELKLQLDEIDLKKMRPTSAIALNVATDEDIERLKELEAQAQEIRKQIQELS